MARTGVSRSENPTPSTPVGSLAKSHGKGVHVAKGGSNEQTALSYHTGKGPCPPTTNFHFSLCQRSRNLEKPGVPPFPTTGLHALRWKVYCVCVSSLDGSCVYVLPLPQGCGPKTQTMLYEKPSIAQWVPEWILHTEWTDSH